MEYAQFTAQLIVFNDIQNENSSCYSTVDYIAEETWRVIILKAQLNRILVYYLRQSTSKKQPIKQAFVKC